MIPRGQALALIHLIAIGATTNTLLAYVMTLSLRASTATVFDDVIFWGVNAGLLGFATVLTVDARGGIYVFVPAMGAALLVAIAVHFVRLSRDVEHEPAVDTLRQEPEPRPT